MCDTQLLLGRLKLRGDLAKFRLKLTSALRERVAVATEGRIALPKDRNLVDLLRELVVRGLGDSSLNGTFSLLAWA